MNNRFEMHDNGNNVPAALRFTIYDKREDIVVAAYRPEDETKAVQDTQTLNRHYN